MKKLILILAIAVGLAEGAGAQITPLGSTSVNATNWIKGSLKVDSALQFTNFANSDTAACLSTDVNGRMILIHVSAGSTFDTLTYTYLATHYYVDSSRQFDQNSSDTTTWDATKTDLADSIIAIRALLNTPTIDQVLAAGNTTAATATPLDLYRQNTDGTTSQIHTVYGSALYGGFPFYNSHFAQSTFDDATGSFVNEEYYVPNYLGFGNFIYTHQPKSGTYSFLSDIQDSIGLIGLQRILDNNNVSSTFIKIGTGFSGTTPQGTEITDKYIYRFQNSGTGHVIIDTCLPLTTFRYQVHPDKSGTYAMTSDITLQNATNNNDSISSNVIFHQSSLNSTIDISGQRINITNNSGSSQLTPTAFLCPFFSFTASGGGSVSVSGQAAGSGTYNQTLQGKNGTIATRSDITLANALDSGNVARKSIKIGSNYNSSIIDTSSFTLYTAGIISFSAFDNIMYLYKAGSTSGRNGIVSTATATVGDTLTDAAGIVLVGRTGTATLSSGTVTITDANVRASSVVTCVYRTESGTLGTYFVNTVSAGASFTITSKTLGSVATGDNSTVQYTIFH